MKKLEQHQRKNGFDYELVERNDKAAIYKQVENYGENNEYIVAYEVFLIKIRKDKSIVGNFIEGGEIFPSNEDFGKNAWTYSTFLETLKDQALKKAYNKYNSLNN
jgi:acetoacetate decarboxylase